MDDNAYLASSATTLISIYWSYHHCSRSYTIFDPIANLALALISTHFYSPCTALEVLPCSEVIWPGVCTHSTTISPFEPTVNALITFVSNSKFLLLMLFQSRHFVILASFPRPEDTWLLGGRSDWLAAEIMPLAAYGGCLICLLPWKCIVLSPSVNKALWKMVCHIDLIGVHNILHSCTHT